MDVTAILDSPAGSETGNLDYPCAEERKGLLNAACGQRFVIMHQKSTNFIPAKYLLSCCTKQKNFSPCVLMESDASHRTRVARLPSSAPTQCGTHCSPEAHGAHKPGHTDRNPSGGATCLKVCGQFRILIMKALVPNRRTFIDCCLCII